MITLTRLNGVDLVVNAAHIATVEATPDTLVTLHNGLKYLVKQGCNEVVAATTAWFRGVGLGPVLPSSDPPKTAQQQLEDWDEGR